MENVRQYSVCGGREFVQKRTKLNGKMLRIRNITGDQVKWMKKFSEMDNSIQFVQT